MEERSTMSRFTTFVFLLVIAVLIVVARNQQELEPSRPVSSEIISHVKYVVDGDTVILSQADGSELTIRLEGIDAPERGQPFGDRSRQWLANATANESVRLVTSGTDRYGRTLGDLYINDRWLNLELVASGLAWHYARFRQSSRLASAQREAQNKNLGLWQDPNRIAPWDYRDRER